MPCYDPCYCNSDFCVECNPERVSEKARQADDLERQLKEANRKNGWLTAALCLVTKHLESFNCSFNDIVEEIPDEAFKEAGITRGELVAWKIRHNREDALRRGREGI